MIISMREAAVSYGKLFEALSSKRKCKSPEQRKIGEIILNAPGTNYRKTPHLIE